MDILVWEYSMEIKHFSLQWKFLGKCSATSISLPMPNRSLLWRQIELLCSNGNQNPGLDRAVSSSLVIKLLIDV